MSGSEPTRDRWCLPLNAAVYPSARNWDRPRDAAAMGCPPFAGKASVLDLPAGVSCVQPGLHRGEQGKAEVVWWDPAALDLDVAPSGGSAQKHVLEIECEGEEDATGVNPVTEEQRVWAERLRADIDSAAAPSIRTVSVTAHAGARAEAGERTHVEVEVHRVDAQLAARPAGRRFGSLGMGRYAHALASFILDCKTPMSVGIQGDWGLGRRWTHPAQRGALGR